MSDDKNRIEDLRELGRLRQQELEIMKQAEASVSGRVKLMLTLRKINKDLVNSKKQEKKILTIIAELEKDGSDEALKELALAEAALVNAVNYRKELEKSLAINKKAYRQSLLTISVLKSGGGLLKTWGWDKLKKWGVFDIDKELRNAARTIGVSGKQYAGFAKNLSVSAAHTSTMGVNLKELAKMQADYSDGIGRATILTEQGNIAMAAMANGTGLGGQFAVEMAVAMDNFGAGAEASRDLVAETMNVAGEMGVSGSKAAKTLQKTLQMAQKYNFKGGVKSLAKMANSAVKLKLDMDGIAGVADKVFRPEGAIELAAQLKTMGGGFAKIADPMQLMFKARNDFEGFAKDIGKASAEFVDFNKESGKFEVKGGLARDRMREIANMTGISVEKLREMAIAQKRVEAIGSITPINFDDDANELISGLAEMGDDGEWKVNIGGVPKDVKKLKKEDLKRLKKEKESLEKRAKDNRTFTDTLDDMWGMLQQLLLPVAIALKTAFGEPLQAFIDTLNSDGVTKRITEWTFKLVEVAKDFGAWAKESIPAIIQFGKDMWAWIKWGGEWLGTIAKTLGPGGTLAVLIGGPMLFDAFKWALNGTIFGAAAKVAMGGLSAIGGGTGQLGGKAMGMRNAGAMDKMGLSKTQKMGANFKGGLSSKLLKVGGLVAGLTSAYQQFGENKEAGMGTGENLVRSGTKGVGAGVGAWGGAAAGAAIGSAVPVVGTLIGGLIGGALGAWGGGAAGEGLANAIGGEPDLNDGIVKFNPKDKFLKVNDSTMIAGTNAGGNKDLAKAMTGGGSNKMTVTHEHKPIKMIFEFIGLSENTANELINNDRFVKSLNIKIKEATANVFSGGKPSPNPSY